MVEVRHSGREESGSKERGKRGEIGSTSSCSEGHRWIAFTGANKIGSQTGTGS